VYVYVYVYVHVLYRRVYRREYEPLLTPFAPSSLGADPGGLRHLWEGRAGQDAGQRRRRAAKAGRGGRAEQDGQGERAKRASFEEDENTSHN